MKKNHVRHGILLGATLALFCSACGGGGARAALTASPLLTSLSGTWFGPATDAIGSLHTLELTFGPTGGLDVFILDGTDKGVRGSATAIKDSAYRVYTCTLSDGTPGTQPTLAGFLADRNYDYMAFYATDGTFAALTRDEVELRPGGYEPIDVLPSTWVGTVLQPNANLSPALVSGLQGSLTSGAAFSFNDLETPPFYTATPPSPSDIRMYLSTDVGPLGDGTVYGVFDGNFLDDFGNGGPIRMLLTSDRKFMAVINCWFPWPTNVEKCRFGAWRRL